MDLYLQFLLEPDRDARWKGIPVMLCVRFESLHLVGLEARWRNENAQAAAAIAAMAALNAASAASNTTSSAASSAAATIFCE